MTFELFPPEASAQAHTVDMIFLALCLVSIVIVLALLATGITFVVRYRRGSRAKRGELPKWLHREIEITWTVGTLFGFVFFFWFAAATFMAEYKTPPNALEIHVVGKQWMWKIRHPDGAREINELHVPVDTPIDLVMTSEDVIHSFFLPALRLKQDVVPGRYTSESFTADKTGTYKLLCAEFCGRGHAFMGGQLIIQSKADYEKWSRAEQQVAGLSDKGRELFTRMGCSGCHLQTKHEIAPNLAGIYGSNVELASGKTVRADEAYLRDSILQPATDVVAGYQAIMPSFEGALNESQLSSLVAFLKSYSGDGDEP